MIATTTKFVLGKLQERQWLFFFFSRGLITQPQIEQLMNLTSVAAAVALAVWEIRASKQQIGLTVTSAKQGQISDARRRREK